MFGAMDYRKVVSVNRAVQRAVKMTARSPIFQKQEGGVGAIPKNKSNIRNSKSNIRTKYTKRGRKMFLIAALTTPLASVPIPGRFTS